MIWFTSDLHFGHRAVIQYCNRPYEHGNIEKMDADLVKTWNATVKRSELVYCLGDMSFHKPGIGVPLLRELNGRKILILGNHDKYSAKQYGDAGFIHIMVEAKIHIAGHSVKLSHYPYWDESENDSNGRRYQERRPQNQGDWLLCGHVHTAWKQKEQQINVGVDVWGMKPVSIDVIQAAIQRGSV